MFSRFSRPYLRRNKSPSSPSPVHVSTTVAAAGSTSSASVGLPGTTASREEQYFDTASSPGTFDARSADCDDTMPSIVKAAKGKQPVRPAVERQHVSGGYRRRGMPSPSTEDDNEEDEESKFEEDIKEQMHVVMKEVAAEAADDLVVVKRPMEKRRSSLGLVRKALGRFGWQRK